MLLVQVDLVYKYRSDYITSTINNKLHVDIIKQVEILLSKTRLVYSVYCISN